MSDDWYTDYRQNRRLKELEGEVEAAYSYAAQRSRVLQSRLSDVQGTIERRLDRMAKSFDAFVELSDIRLELAVFDRETAVRYRTRRLLMGLEQGATDPPLLGLDDCPGYWLKPGAEGLAALVRGDGEAAEKFIADAVARDEDRTTLFLTLGLAVAGRYPEAVPWLSRSLPSLGTTVTAVQRQLWIACADGAFGDPGREHIERRLTEVLDEMSPEALQEQRGAWLQTLSEGTDKVRTSLPRELQNQQSITEPPKMAQRLTMLRTRVEAALQPFDAAPASDFADLLTTLVDEGSPDERTLVARARELRQIIETGATSPPTAWDAPAGTTVQLLHGDVFASTAPGPRALGARVGRRWLRSIADDLAEGVAVRPPEEIEIRLYGHPLRIRPDGVSGLEEAQADVERSASVSHTGEWLGIAVAVVGVLVMVLTIVAGLPALAVLAALMIIVGGGIWIKLGLDRRRAREGAELDKERLSRQSKSIAEALQKCLTSHKELAENAKTDREAILTVLT